MTEPTPEAMEAAARALPDAMACAPWPPASEDELLAAIEAGHLSEDYDLADANHRAYLAIVREVVTAAWPIAEATVRAKVAAEIRAESLGWCMDGTGRHLVENCVKIADPPKLCANCGRPVVPGRTSTGWTHDDKSGWAGVRCPGAITGARIAEGKGDET